MRTVTERIREHLEAAAFPRVLPDLSSLRESEWCPEFERHMRNRLVMGAFRYGLFSDPDKFAYQCLDSIRRRLAAFEQDGNLEHLVDAANLCMIEYVRGQRNGLVLNPIDDGEHVTKG